MDTTTLNRIPFFDLREVNARHEHALKAALNRVLESGWYLRGEETRKFESEFATWNGSRHCVCAANGLDALRLTLEAWRTMGLLSVGDEVIVPANSFIASALAVTHAGLTVRFADVDSATHNLTVDTVTAALTSRTRVVMAVHLYGQLADIERIRLLCDAGGLLLLEDAAQAHGATGDGVRAGAFGHAGAFSFYPAKNLGALGDAGCVVTCDHELAERVAELGNYGSSQKYIHEFLGSNSRMDEIQAAVLSVKLGCLDEDNERRRVIARHYCEGIAHRRVRSPAMPSDRARHVWHQFVVTCDRRRDLMQHLEANGVEVMIHYPRAIHRQAPYIGLPRPAPPLATVERLQDEVLSLPIFPVMSDDQVRHVVAAVNAWPDSG